MTVTCITIHPAVTKGRPNIRVPAWPFVFMQLSSRYASLFRSAKSCVECRERKNAKTKRSPPRMANSNPTVCNIHGQNKGLVITKTTYFDENPVQTVVESSKNSQGIQGQCGCMLHERFAALLSVQQVH